MQLAGRGRQGKLGRVACEAGAQGAAHALRLWASCARSLTCLLASARGCHSGDLAQDLKIRSSNKQPGDFSKRQF